MNGSAPFKLIIAGVVIVVLIAGFWLCTYQLDETEQAVITAFGKPVGSEANNYREAIVSQAGLHFKLPFIRRVHRFDKRVLAWDGTSQDMVTAEQKNITIDTTARWRIDQPLTFYESFGNERRAQSRLDDVLHEQVQTTIASTDLTEIVRSKSWEIKEEDLQQVVRPEGEGKQLEQEVRTGRAELAENMRKQAAKALNDYGVTLLDLRIKRINYVDQVQQRVFQRMISERQRIATKFRQEGKEQAKRISAEADREVAKIKADADREGQVIRGEADAEATRIYNEAYGDDPDFYAFMRTLESYQNALGKDSVLMLSTDSAYFRYLRRLRPDSAPDSASTTAGGPQQANPAQASTADE